MEKRYLFYNNPYSFSHNLSNRNSYFISKEDYIDKITDLFNRNQRTVLINSDSGNGKSSLALEYGHRFIEKNKENNHVYWLKLTSDYMFIELKVLADKFGIEVLKQNEEELIIEIKDKLFYFHKKILFIFDNLDDLDYVKLFIELLNEQSNIFILIKKKMKKITNEELDDLIALYKLNSKKYTNPLVLNSMIGYINYKTKSVVKIGKVLEKLKNDSKETIQKENDLENITIDLILNDEKINNIIKITTVLDPDFIPIDFYTEIFEINEQELGDCFEILEKLEIMKNDTKEDIEGKKIHSKIHHFLCINVRFRNSKLEFDKIVESFNNYLKNKNQLQGNRDTTSLDTTRIAIERAFSFAPNLNA